MFILNSFKKLGFYINILRLECSSVENLGLYNMQLAVNKRSKIESTFLILEFCCGIKSIRVWVKKDL